VPVVLVFTKFDLVVSQVLFDIAGGDPQHHEHARVRAQSMYEESCRRLLHEHFKDVPAEIVSSICSSFAAWEVSLTPSAGYSKAGIW
jgi:hypothetical protein